MEAHRTHADYSNFELTLKVDTLQSVIESYGALSSQTRNWVANLANASSLLWHAYQLLNIPINWAGFYVVDPKQDDQLILGPFQGKVACQMIKFGKGVCGTAAARKETQLVDDVTKFPGHIACDGETKSEIVIPIVVNDKTVGVLDIDCLVSEGFDIQDEEMLETLARVIASSSDW
ncbi:hypothetical protein METBIDRAFT_77660 [Metschnikowia bicuspidata var. bicuspidata NRRL YB-4993]|uniref:GAF domain-containing protein n=1 Tax=Metschnikowia bicuspidata var. bicuspidata NRRL YB-4993 TaxID=869754 RepID=A0A1A0HE73_9ASCO|nr:hypothetical protein METBIDRAFT_77660 [Metschnikowia bicuspidata var. bicuspidata NRRL YB-4993]OBA22203.1 hypothetical protein METBIDRAFT_77660 [Metschnikowia bicuspidata var. bicuspidata NRRL YB-4993]